MDDDTPETNELFLFLASTAHDMKNSISVLSGTLERLIADAMNGDQTLFIRGDEAEAAWEVIDLVLEGWKKSTKKPEPRTRATPPSTCSGRSSVPIVSR